MFSLVTSVLGLLFSIQAFAATIPNELGEPKAGGLPRESSSEYEILYGSVRVGSDIQRVIVTKPLTSSPSAAMLLVGGIGCYSLDFSGTGPKVVAYERIIEFVSRMGFVTMRVEKTGMGDSVGTRCEDQDFKREVTGYLAGLRALQSYPFVKKDSISIFGHSIGGVIAPFLAAKVPVKSVAVIGSLATDWYTYDIANIRRQMILSGASGLQLEYYLAKKQLAALEFYRNKKSPEQIMQEHPEVTDALREEWESAGVSPAYMQQLGDVNPTQDWLRSRAPVTVFVGTADFIGSQMDELSVMVSGVNKTRSTPLTLRKVEGMDHFFRAAGSQSESFSSQRRDGFPLLFQDSFLQILKDEFLLSNKK